MLGRRGARCLDVIRQLSVSAQPPEVTIVAEPDDRRLWVNPLRAPPRRPSRGTVPHPAPVRLTLFALGTAVPLALGTLVAPAAHADERPLPPGLRSLPDASAAPLHAVPITEPFGRKLR